MHIKNRITFPIGIGTGIGGFKAKYSFYPKKQIELIRLAIDLGVDFIDTSEDYGDGDAELNIGKAIIGKREEIIIATKAKQPFSGRENRGSLERIRCARPFQESRVLPLFRNDFADAGQTQLEEGSGDSLWD